jgi:hypothetical protein
LQQLRLSPPKRQQQKPLKQRPPQKLQPLLKVRLNKQLAKAKSLHGKGGLWAAFSFFAPVCSACSLAISASSMTILPFKYWGATPCSFAALFLPA